MRRREQYDLPGVCGDPLERRRSRRERRGPDEEHAVDAVRRASSVSGAERSPGIISTSVGRLADADSAHGAKPATGIAQLRDHLPADLAGRAGDEDALIEA